MIIPELYSTTELILSSCESHISHITPHAESSNKIYDILWLKSTVTKFQKAVYLLVSAECATSRMNICECKLYRIDRNGRHFMINDMTSEVDIALQNSISYIRSLFIFNGTKTDLPPAALMEDILDHLDPSSPSLILFGGVNGAGKTTTVKVLVDYVIDTHWYQSDDVIIINNDEDFTVLLDNISIGRVDHPAFVVFDELHTAGDMFAVSTLLEANCSVVVVTEAETFSGMAKALLRDLEGNRRDLIVEDVKKSLVYMLLHNTGYVTADSYQKHTYKTMSATNNRGLDLFDMMALNGEYPLLEEQFS